MTKVCTHGRDKNVAMRMLEESLRASADRPFGCLADSRSYLRQRSRPDLPPDGAIEALAQAKQQGKVRFVGFTGHKDPSIHLKMLAHDFPFDTVQMPLNCLDATFRSFEQQVLPELHSRGIAALGMKSMGGSGEMVRHGAVTPGGSAALRDESAGGDDDQRHGFRWACCSRTWRSPADSSP